MKLNYWQILKQQIFFLSVLWVLYKLTGLQLPIFQNTLFRTPIVNEFFSFLLLLIVSTTVTFYLQKFLRK